MDARTINYLKSLFRNYYVKKGKQVLTLPQNYQAREFAAQLWGVKGYVRHMAFDDIDKLLRWIVDKAPRHFFYSSAVYQNPAAENMDEKGWLGADLTFDIDADHLPQCSSKLIEVEDKSLGIKATFAPPECVKEAAWEALKLVDILVYELGFEKSRIRVEFSGHRGFHVIIDCSDIQECFTSDSQIRKEIVDYVKALDVNLDELIPLQAIKQGRKKIYPVPPSIYEAGVRGRVARIAYRLSLRKKLVKIASIFDARSALEAFTIAKQAKDEYESILNEAKENVFVEVDVQVTVDVKRLIRVPGSLHGKTGLVVKIVDINRLDDFELTNSLSPFTNLGEIKVRALVSTPPIDIFNYTVKLHAGDVLKLPAEVAIYLMCKEVAVLA